MTPSDDLVAFVQGWEGLKLAPSGDPLVPGVVDVGYGHCLQTGEERRPITADEALELLRWDLYIDAEAIEPRISVGLLQHEFDACLAFSYNVGVSAFIKSTLLRLLNAGDFPGAADEFPKWNKAGGRVVPGLAKRRAAEQAMFRSADYGGRP
jgi:lysozyme